MMSKISSLIAQMDTWLGHDFSIMEVGDWVDADQSTGRLVHIPNSSVFTQRIANDHTVFSYLWNELTVVVTQRFVAATSGIDLVGNPAPDDTSKKAGLSNG